MDRPSNNNADKLTSKYLYLQYCYIIVSSAGIKDTIPNGLSWGSYDNCFSFMYIYIFLFFHSKLLSFTGSTSKMSRADQLLSKLPPPTPLPSYVTDALNGNLSTNAYGSRINYIVKCF